MRRICIVTVLVASILGGMLCMPMETSAYKFNGYRLDNPDNIRFSVSTIAMQFYPMFVNGLDAWESECPEIGVASISGDNIYFYSDTSVDNGTYAVCRHFNDNTHTITVFKDFLSLPATERNETVVHEIGHALGLAHCQDSKNSISVMREYGFNGKAYPLSDDIQGIDVLYG